MFLENLRVIHYRHYRHDRRIRPGEASGSDRDAGLRALIPPGAFLLETCQRRLWVYPSDLMLDPMPQQNDDGLFQNTSFGIDFFQGREAYRFLLRVATGLESEIQGETEIFGQLKEAWRVYEAADGCFARSLSPWIQHVFEDAKEVRADHFRELNHASYGSLVRGLLRKNGARPGDAVFLVGAGQLAATVAPWLKQYDLWLWNRTPGGAERLARDLRIQAGDELTLRLLSREDEEAQAWRSARYAVVCIPAGLEADARRARLWEEGSSSLVLGAGSSRRLVIHLGCHRSQAGPWRSVHGFVALDDLFSLQEQADGSRVRRLEQAARLCEDRSKLRALGGSVTLAHGWEDLAAFPCA